MGPILIVDDEPGIRATLGQALELEGFAWTGAADLGEARAALRKSRPAALLLDVRLPDGDGLTFLEELRAAGASPPVVMMSGHGSIEDAVRALNLGARDFLEKPVGQDRMLVTLRNALELARLERVNASLEEAAEAARLEDPIVGRSAAVEALRRQIERVGPSEGRVLITGENGTGKELVALAVHAASARKRGPFVSLNCGAVPAELIESELFGHEKGAFTGAVARKVGKFERADGGTLFLDEVGDMPAAMQVKLLRVLQTGELERVGGAQPIRVDVRVVAATNRDLMKAIEDGDFREDLFYRLNVVPIHVPPLRDRKEDIPLLAERFLADAAAKNHRPRARLSPRALARLAEHNYPGNVRELRNLVERIVILSEPGAETLDHDDVDPYIPGRRRERPAVGYRPGTKLSDLVGAAERSIVAEALEAHDGNIPETAKALGVERSNFHKKLKALGLKDSAS
jgi:DNA-binding NtrC family response regulator